MGQIWRLGVHILATLNSCHELLLHIKYQLFLRLVFFKGSHSRQTVSCQKIYSTSSCHQVMCRLLPLMHLLRVCVTRFKCSFGIPAFLLRRTSVGRTACRVPCKHTLWLFHVFAIWVSKTFHLKIYRGFNVYRTSMLSCLCISMMTPNSSVNMQKHWYLRLFHAVSTRENISRFYHIMTNTLNQI